MKTVGKTSKSFSFSYFFSQSETKKPESKYSIGIIGHSKTIKLE
jgi:hypothetical protein